MPVVIEQTNVIAAPAAVSPAPAHWHSLSSDRVLRSIGQTALFGAFGVGGALVTALSLPSFLVLPAATRRRAARATVRRLLRAYTGAMQSLRLIDVELRGMDHLQRPGQLVVANHPTLIDAFFLLAHVPGLGAVAKRALLGNPFTAGAVRAADYVVNDDGPALIDTCRARLAAGESLLLFPEGTRTAADGVIRLRRGASQLAVRAGCPVVPVTIDVNERILTRAQPWWRAAAARPRFTITAHAPIDPAPFIAAGANAALAARRLNAHLQGFYSKELGSRGSV